MRRWWLVMVATMTIVFQVWPIVAEADRPARSDSATRSHQSIHPERFRRVLLEHLRGSRPLEGVEVAVRVLFPDREVSVPDGMLAFRLVPDAAGLRTGRRAFRIRVFVDDRLVKTVNVVAAVSARARLPTPVRWIRTQEILAAGDLRVIQAELPILDDTLVRHSREAIGKKVLRPLAPHRPIQRTSLAAPPQIRKGDRVLIEARRRGLLVQTVGIAKGSGQTGETIVVVNQASGREVLGTVLRSGVVEVSF